MDELLSIFTIIGIDLILGGDNAIIIALACRNLPLHIRNKAIIIGTFLAILIRILLTIFTVYLLKVPFIQVLGGLLLLYIAFSFIIDKKGNENKINSPYTLMKAVQTIVLADLFMGLDNVVAVAGAAKGNTLLVAFGLSLSIPIIVWGSKILLSLMNRFPLILYIGGAILAFTAGEMIIQDESIAFLLHESPQMVSALPFILMFSITITAVIYSSITSKITKS
ncbi:TerC family protein [Bacillus carboniphilus]|uniref:TerC family protein n=1 Tax=Bacillus carboniphilus TaxID=86663 RepID=A0ABY9JZC4_9BACI|nr:TerC family protein [Bacillus carboniphilus]WLR42950.1 TerC family protein [Bacillus carboniphilus]